MNDHTQTTSILTNAGLEETRLIGRVQMPSNEGESTLLKIDRQRQSTRRGLLRAGALGLGGLCMPSLLRLRSAAGADSSRKDTAVIFLFLHGGPSQLETYDL